MATMPNPLMMPGGPGAEGPPPPNPMLMALMQRLAGQARSGQGGPGGALAAAQGVAQTPFGQESQDLKDIQTRLGAMVPRFLQRDSGIASKLVNAYKTLSDVLEAVAKLPAQPVMAPPPGLPMAGGPAMMPPPDASPFG